MERTYPNLFTPLTVRGLRFRNRIFSSPNSTRLRSPDGGTTEREIAYYEEKAKGGAGQVTVGETMVNYHYLREAQGYHLDIHNVNHHMMLNELANAISMYGAVSSIQLVHPGLSCTPEIMGGLHPVSSSGMILPDGTVVDEMDEDMIERTLDDYVRSALVVKDCGFQMLQLHGGHGWLPAQFLSPHFNHRKDKYGGSLENRARFCIELVERVRKAVGERYVLEYRISGDEMVPDGMKIDDTIEFIKMIEDKIDIVHVSATLHDNQQTNHYMFPHTEFTERGCNVHLAAAVKRAGVKCLVETVGGIDSPEHAERILANGEADIIGMARGLIADPEWANKARRGEADRIVPCLRCSECVINLQYNRFACQVNPRIGRSERLKTIAEPSAKKRAVIVGGGPAGMQAAITASKRGHEVTLLEKSGQLGGLLNHAEYDPHKTDLLAYRNYLVRETTRLVKDIRLNCKVTPELVESLHPDAVIAAVGAEPIRPRIDGITKDHVFDAMTAYRNIDSLPEGKVVIIGGGVVGCELGIALADKGREIAIVEMTDFVGDRVNWRHTIPMMQKISDTQSISVYRQTTVMKIDDGKVCLRHLEDGKEEYLDCGCVVYSIGLRPRSDIVESLRDTATDFIPIGDCLRSGKILGAVHSAYYAAMNL